MNNFAVGLDIGSHAIKAIVGEVGRDGGLTIVDVLTVPSSGLRKGIIQDVSDATQALSPIIGEIRKISKAASSNIFLSRAEAVMICRAACIGASPRRSPCT